MVQMVTTPKSSIIPRQLSVTGRTLSGVGAAGLGAGAVALYAGARNNKPGLTALGALGLVLGAVPLAISNESLLLPVSLGAVAGAAGGFVLATTQNARVF